MILPFLCPIFRENERSSEIFVKDFCSQSKENIFVQKKLLYSILCFLPIQRNIIREISSIEALLKTILKTSLGQVSTVVLAFITPLAIFTVDQTQN